MQFNSYIYIFHDFFKSFNSYISYLLFKFEVEFRIHQTKQPTASIGRWSPTLRYDYDVML